MGDSVKDLFEQAASLRFLLHKRGSQLCARITCCLTIVPPMVEGFGGFGLGDSITLP